MRVPTFVGEGDRYKIDKEIGRGGMGSVYRAYDKNTGQYVAIKTMLDGTNPEVQALFDKETKILAELQHPNIIGITDRGDFRDGGTKYPFFVMPFLKGKTLQERIRSEENPLTVEQVVAIIATTADSLQAAHARGVIHRDIKPSNIFVLDSGPVVVIDFGVVHLAENRVGTVLKGTTPYMAPELLDPKKGESPSPASDLFSLGVVCYEALTGTHPFVRPGANDQQVKSAVLHEIPVPAFEVNRNLNLVLSQVVQKSMAKDRNHRYASVKEFAEKLERAFRSEPLPEFDRQTIEGKLRVVRDALSRGQTTSANELMRSIEEDGFIDPAITSQREKIDQVLQRKWVREQIDSARLYREASQQVAALEKLNEVLRRFPENDEALTERDSIQEERYSKLLNDARSLMDRHLFADARLAIQEARGIQPRDTRTAELFGEVTRMEGVDRDISERKATLYQEAQKANKDGHSGTALRKLEQLMEMIRQFPISSSERDPIYRSFYETLLGEQERLEQAGKEVRRRLLSGDAAGALSFCDEILSSNPGNPLFEALRLEAESRERQARIDCVDRICEDLDKIQDLDARVKMLQDAVAQLPNESQLAELLRSNKAKRELVHGLVARARRSEVPGRHGTALELWHAVRECHPLYEGIEKEILRVEKVYQAEVREDRRVSLVHEISGFLRAGDYRQATARAEAALEEFPADEELLAYHVEAKERVLFAPMVQNLIADGRRLLREGNLDGALETFRKAAGLDRNNQQVRQILGESLLDKAKSARGVQDTVVADEFFEEARKLIPDHPEIKGWVRQPRESNRGSGAGIEDVLAASRELSSAGNLKGALAKIEQTLKVHPSDSRLLAELARLRKMPVGSASPEATILEGDLHPSSLDSILGEHFDAREPGVDSVVNLPPAPSRLSRISQTAATYWSGVQNRVGTAAKSLTPYRKPVYVIPAIAIMTVLIALSGYVVWNSRGPKLAVVVPSPALVPLRITSVPDGAEIYVNGERIGNSPVHLDRPPASYTVKVAMVGYETKELNVQLGSDSRPENVTLAPLPMNLHLLTPVQSKVDVLLDGQLATAVAQNDEVVVENISSGSHELKIQAGGRKPVQAMLNLDPGRLPTSKMPSRDQAGYLFVSSLGRSLRAECNCPNGSTLKLNDGVAQPLPPEGIEMSLPESVVYTLEFAAPGSKRIVSAATSPNPSAMIMLYNWNAEALRPALETVEELIKRARGQIDSRKYSEARKTLDKANASANETQAAEISSLKISADQREILYPANQ